MARVAAEACLSPDLALMAEREAKPARFILFTKARVSQETILALAPLAVKPCFQKKYWDWDRSCKKGHTLAAKAGFAYAAAVLGDLHFTVVWVMKRQKNGELRRQRLFLKEYFMAIKLIPDAAPLAGTIVYDRAFGL